mmetsp:Transcript_23097/g.41234  ORF Transcript_23097/g.41234 Transcript_23097/m.41234 type:complete len:698 (-) Transcript_23097:186-2279(-)
MVGFRVVNKSSFTFETDLPPASRDIHPSGILHAFRSTASPSTIKNSIRVTSQTSNADVSSDNDDDDDNNKNSPKLPKNTSNSISNNITEEHTFAWIQNTFHIETALSLFTTHGFQDSNTVFIPYSTKANWLTKYPHAEPAMECLDDGKCVVIMNWRPYPNALGEGGIRDALGAAGNGDDVGDADDDGGDKGGGKNDAETNAAIEKRSRRRYAARSKVNLFNDKNFIPDAERDELHVEIYNYLVWLKEKAGDVERREEEIEFERKVAAMVPPVEVEEEDGNDGDGEEDGGGDGGDDDNDEEAGGEEVTRKKKSAAVEKGGRKKTGINFEELQGVLDKMEAAFYILPNAKLEAAEEEAAVAAVAAAEKELAAAKSAEEMSAAKETEEMAVAKAAAENKEFAAAKEEEAAAVAEAASEEMIQQKRQRQEGEEEEEEEGGDWRVVKKRRGGEQEGEQEQGGEEAAGEPMGQGDEGAATTGRQPAQEGEGAAGEPDHGGKAVANEPNQADKDAAKEQQPTQEGIEASTEQPPNDAEANAEADGKEIPPPPKESKPTLLESALSEALFQKVMARDLAGMPKRRSRKRRRQSRKRRRQVRDSAPRWQVEGFDEMFQRLKDYKEEHGTCAVPRNPRKTDEMYGKVRFVCSVCVWFLMKSVGFLFIVVDAQHTYSTPENNTCQLSSISVLCCTQFLVVVPMAWGGN